MRKERKNLPLSALELNAGQLGWMPRNPRQWTKDDVARTARSIEEDPDFLEERPLLVVPSDVDGKFVVFGGNLRSEGARKNRMKAVPCVVHYPESEEDRQTVIRRALKDNGSMGRFDYDILANEYSEYDLTDFGIPAWEQPEGSEDDGSGGEGGRSGAREDDFDEQKAGILVRCKEGDIWQLGDHRLMCGDSTDLETVKSLMGVELADMVFTDPPYGVAIGSKNSMLNSVQPSGRCCKDIAHDTDSVDELYGTLRKAMENVRLNCKEDASYYVCAPPGGDFGLMMMMMRDAGLNVRHQIVWNKNAATFSLGRLDYDYKHEAIMYTWTKKHHNYRKGAFRTSVWDIEKPMKNGEHPTMKPVELVANCLLDGTKEDDIVLDAFGGSGTTLIAAEQLGRKARLMEIDPHYCDVIIARWEKLTRKTATKIN